MNVLDSSAWIEFFLGSRAGETYRPVVAELASLLVPSVALLEVHRFLSRTASSAMRDEHLDVMRRAQVVDLTDARAIAASEAAQKHKLAMADAIMYSIAREFKATFWTQDVDYEGLPGVRYRARP
jgi:predicted nucleic acid-binding protein